MYNVVAIIVTFNPDAEVLYALLKAIEPQVTHIVVVDNGSPVDIVEIIERMIPDNGQLIEKGYNSGISEAINTGILEASERRVSHVVCFDQDSLPALDMVEQLLAVMEQKNDESIKVAAVGPKYSDVKGHYASPFVKLVDRRLQRIECGDAEVVPVDHLITSGCLISMGALNDVGNMEHKLFIDYVDTEWCLRAINKGYSLFGVGAARMEHDLGDGFVNVFGRSIPVHIPLRNYYLIRNGVWLLSQPWVSLNWKTMDFIRLTKIYLVYSLFVGRGFENWKMMTKGLWHAITGRMGRYGD